MGDRQLLALDPGPSFTGWASVSLDGPRVTFAAGGKIESVPGEIGQLFLEHAPDVVAIESPSGFIFGKSQGEIQGRAKQLMATAKVAGVLEGLAIARRVRVVTCTCAEWRKLTCGKAAATDHDVEDLVTRTVLGMPKRTNVHVRDALGLAIAAAWMLASERSEVA
jgi:Holliday junction resolvasome RuvABC endonuclease subunit